MDWLRCVLGSLLMSIVTFWGIGGLVHYHYYVRRKADASTWKIQPKRWLNNAQFRLAMLLGGFNLTLGSFLGGTMAWHIMRGGWSRVYFAPAEHGWVWFLLSGPVMFFVIDAGLYYSHRLLHHRAIFRYIHRHHHRFTAPVVFTTTAMHPVEFLIFATMLFLPAFVVPIHAGVYIAVLLYTYLIGMIDHSGIKLGVRLPFHASNAFHDEHHTAFHCNYGHHTALWDRLHGTVKRDDRAYGEHIFHGGRSSQLEETRPGFEQ